MKLLATLFLAFFATSTLASPVVIWDGPGPNACAGNCSFEWAKSLLTDEQVIELNKAMEDNPDGQLVMVSDGDYIPLMTYFDGESPQADRRGTVASLERDEPATGWVMDGWSFIKIHGCQNWAIVRNDVSVGPTRASYEDADASAYTSSLVAANGVFTSTTGGGNWTSTGGGGGGSTGGGWTFTGGGGGGVTTCCNGGGGGGTTVVVDPAPVPLPASVFGLLFALGSLGYMKTRQT